MSVGRGYPAMSLRHLLPKAHYHLMHSVGIVMTLKVRCVDLAALIATARAIRETMPDFGQEIIEFAAEIGHGTHDLHEL